MSKVTTKSKAKKKPATKSKKKAVPPAIEIKGVTKSFGTKHVLRGADLIVPKGKSLVVAVGLKSEVADLYPAELSGGMQKRVGLARAIAANPEVIFFDEPTTGLDPIMADVINDLIVKSVKELGATALSITHDMGSVRKIADEVALIHEGQIIWHGDVKDLDKSGNPYVEQFIHGRATGPITKHAGMVH